MIRADNFRIETGRYRPARIDIGGLHGLETARPGQLGCEPGQNPSYCSARHLRPLEDQERSYEGP